MRDIRDIILIKNINIFNIKEKNKVMYFNKFCNLFFDKSVSSDKLLYFLRSINYNKLDYTNYFNVILLYYSIVYEMGYYYFKNIDDKLEMLYNFSPILYYDLMKNWDSKDIDFYEDKILKIETSNNFENFHKLLIVYKKTKSSNYSDNVASDNIDKLNDEFKENVYKIAENEPIIIYKLEEEIKESKKLILNVKDALSIIKCIFNSIDEYNYIKASCYLNFLKNTRVSESLIKLISIQLKICLDRKAVDRHDLEIFVSELKLTFYSDTKISTISKGLKMKAINIFLNSFLKVNNENLLLYILYIQRYYEENKDNIDDNVKGDYILKKYDSIISKISNNYIENFNIENFENIQNNQYISYNLVDIFYIYYNRSFKDKSYGEKIYELYQNNKEFIFNKLYKYLIHYLINVVSKSLIITHNIQTLKEFYKEVSRIVLPYTPFITELENLKIIINSLEVSESFMKNINLKIVENYDYLDEKGCKDQTNTLICPICYDNIDNNKITLIECNSCHKYIGHFFCVSNYINNKVNDDNITCPMCRSLFI